MSRASVGDLFEEHELARMYAVLTMALVLGTSLAPFMGGVITRHIGWQFGFLLLAGAAATIVVACYAWLPETRSPNANAHSFGVLWRESRALLVRPLFMGFVLQVALIYALFFVFASLAPYVMTTVLGMTADRFGLYYLFLAGGFFIGNLLVSRSTGHHDVARQINAGLVWQVIGAVAALALVLLGHTHPLYVFVPMMVFSFGRGWRCPT